METRWEFKIIKNDSARLLYDFLLTVVDDNGITTILNKDICKALLWEYGKVNRMVALLTKNLMISTTHENHCLNDCKRTIKISRSITKSGNAPLPDLSIPKFDTTTPTKFESTTKFEQSNINYIINNKVEGISNLKENSIVEDSNSMLKFESTTKFDKATVKQVLKQLKLTGNQFWSGSPKRLRYLLSKTEEQLTKDKENGNQDAKYYFYYKTRLN